MNLSVLIYIEHDGPPGARAYTVRPAFHATPAVTDAKLSRGLRKLQRQLAEHLRRLAAESRHEELAAFAWQRVFETRNVDVEAVVRRNVLRGRVVVITFRAFDQRIAAIPAIPELWFTVDRGGDVEARTLEVVTEHLRREARRTGQIPAPPKTTGSTWCELLDVQVSIPAAPRKKPKGGGLAFLGGDQEISEGAIELMTVGRDLEAEGDDLARALLRDREADDLVRLVNEPDRRPLLLLGPSGVGKTALLHEGIRRDVRRRKGRRGRRRFHALSPQRLVAGMSYVGQWEARVQEILRHAARRDLVLCFDDVLGLLHAGRSRDVDVSIAQVLRPWLERREVRVIAEMTPGAFARLRERDRGLADLFHVIRVDPVDESGQLRMVAAIVQQTEDLHGCAFTGEAVATARDLCMRYVRHRSPPGNVASFLRELATRHAGRTIERAHVLEEFERRSGFRVRFLDDTQSLPREELVRRLREGLVGQTPAVEAAADAISLAKARLNDGARPIASFLFLGPTGVGKTEAAKQIARVMFGSADRLLRFDMNEFVNAWDAAALVGTPARPEGLLSAAVRRQPFAVVLLDEIEKAHPDVHDLLLQVLGEGRLSDAMGHTADFTNTIVVLTSNLGAREAASSLGFGDDAASGAAVYERAAERFFRPELFNRIDRVLPFSPLTREEVARIGHGLLGQVLAREGVARRRCVVEIDDDVFEEALDAGVDTAMGARALKRSIERLLTANAAAALARITPGTPAVLHLSRRGGPGSDPPAAGSSEIVCRAHVLDEVAPLPARAPVSDPEAEIADLRGRLRELRDRLERHRGDRARAADGVVAVDPADARYFEHRERLQDLVDELDRVEEDVGERVAGAATSLSRAIQNVRGGAAVYAAWERRVPLAEIVAAEDIREFLRDVAAGRPEPDEVRARLVEIDRRRIALEMLLGATSELDVTLSASRNLGARARGDFLIRLAVLGRARFDLEVLDLDMDGAPLELRDEAASDSPDPAPRPWPRRLRFRGPGARRLLASEFGTHLVHIGDQRLAYVIVRDASATTDRDGPPPVVRVLDDEGPSVDLATGAVRVRKLSAQDLEELALDRLLREEDLQHEGDPLREEDRS